MRNGGDSVYRLADAGTRFDALALYAHDGYIYMTVFGDDWERVTHRVNIFTGEKDYKLFPRGIVHFDCENGAIFTQNPGGGLYVADMDGSNERSLLGSGYRFLGFYGGKVYVDASTTFEERSIAALASINPDGSGFSIVAEFTADFSILSECGTEYGKPFMFTRERIESFFVGEDSFYLMVGARTGSASIFTGRRYAVKKDFSDISAVETISEPMTIRRVISVSNYVRGGRYVGGVNRGIYLEHPDSSRVTVFPYSEIPDFSDTESIDIRPLVEIGGYAYIHVSLRGWHEYDCWRGHSNFSGYWRARVDGSELTFLFEDPDLMPQNSMLTYFWVCLIIDTSGSWAALGWTPEGGTADGNLLNAIRSDTNSFNGSVDLRYIQRQQKQ